MKTKLITLTVLLNMIGHPTLSSGTLARKPMKCRMAEFW